MREFLYKNSFFRYCGAINLSDDKSFKSVAPFVSFYILAIIGIANGIMAGSPVVAGVALTACLLFFAGTITGTIRNSAPNLVILAPLSGKRKCVYDFLAVLLFVFIGIMVIAFFIALIAFIIWAVTSVGGGEADTAVDAFFANGTGLYGGIFCAAYTVILYSAGMVGGYFKSRKRRNIFFTVFIVCILSGLIFTGLPYLASWVKISDYPPLASPFSSVCYSYMKLPWLCIALWCVIAVAMFVSAVCMGYRYYKSNKY